MFQSLMCPFTMGQAMNNWNKYWKVVLQDGKNVKARERYQNYMTRVQEEIDKANKEKDEMSSGSHNVRIKEEL